VKALSVKQQKFLSFYLGDDQECHGNATKSYMAAYGGAARSAKVSGKRLLTNANILSQIDAFKIEIQKKTKISAESLLVDSVRMRDIAFGDRSFNVQQILIKKDAKGDEYAEVVDVAVKRLNPQMLGKALELMGRNCVVQAFLEKIDVSHTHVLVDKLNERTKKVTAAAEARKLRLAGGTDVEAA
jgi:phage terminase small subunit